MKIKLTEDINLSELNKEYKDREEIITEVGNRLEEKGFVKTETINGISFDKGIEEEANSFKSQFYIDTTNNRYSGYIYITNTDEEDVISYSIKGPLDQEIFPALNEFIKEFEKMEL